VSDLHVRWHGRSDLFGQLSRILSTPSWGFFSPIIFSFPMRFASQKPIGEKKEGVSGRAVTAFDCNEAGFFFTINIRIWQKD
jgi:hypothetical protein